MRSLFEKRNKKAQGLIQGLVMGVAALVIAVIIAFIVVNTLDDASLLTDNTAQDNATEFIIGNFTEGVNNISEKLPTVLLIAVIVLILGILSILWAQYKRMNVSGGGEL